MIARPNFIVMFVSKQEATGRLSDRENLFRSGDEAVSPAAEESETTENSVPSPTDTGVPESEDVPSPNSLLDLSALDKLIRPRTTSQPLRGRVHAQVATAEVGFIAGSRVAGAIVGVTGRTAHAYQGNLSSSGEALSHPPTQTHFRKQRQALIDDMKERIALKAGNRLKATLRLLTDEKLESVTKPSELSAIAKDMATVMDKVTKKEVSENQGVHFHVWRPEVEKDSASYDTIEVGAAISSTPGLPTIDVTPAQSVATNP